jgi:hypothetical protein
MNRSLLTCLLALSLVQLPACAVYGGASGTSREPQVETKGQQFSRCLDKHSPEECDKIINGPARPRTGGY